MTYDVENALRELAHAREHGDELMRECLRIGLKIADGFRADFDTVLDMETVGIALIVSASSLVPLQDPQIPLAALLNLIGLAGENLVRTARARAAEQAGEVEGVLCEHVLTWHPVNAPDDAPGVEIPLYQHITLPDGIGELRSHAREVVEAGEDEESLANPAADLVVDFLALAGVCATAKQVGGWTRAQREEAARWAAATHLSASDNDDVEVPPRPAFLSEVSGG